MNAVFNLRKHSRIGNAAERVGVSEAITEEPSPTRAESNRRFGYAAGHIAILRSRAGEGRHRGQDLGQFGSVGNIGGGGADPQSRRTGGAEPLAGANQSAGSGGNTP